MRRAQLVKSPHTLELAVLLGDVRQQVADAARVAPLVVVPRDKLDKVAVQSDTGLSVEDGRVLVAGKVGGDNLLLSVAEDALVGGLGSLLDDSLDLVVGGALLEADDKIDDRDIERGDTEGETTGNSC